MEEFEKLLSQARSSVERYVRYRLNGCSDAEDVLQEVYTAAFLKFNQLRSKEMFKPWVLAIARNKCADYFRCRAGKEMLSLEDIPEGQLYHSRQGLMFQSPVEDTMDALLPKERELLHMAYWQQLSQQEIARRMGIPIGTVKSRLHNARQHFKQRYPYPPRDTKGDNMQTKLPKTMPDYTIEWLEDPPFPVKWEELQGWFLVPREGEAIQWAMYDFPKRTRTSWCRMAVVGKAEIHGLEGVEITAIQYGEGDDRDPGFLDQEERRFAAQLTDTHCRYLAESHMENGVRKCTTFLDGEVFGENWGFGDNNCGNEINLVRKRLIDRKDDTVTALARKQVLDVVGCCKVTILGKTYKTVCVMDLETYNESVVTEQYLDEQGRTILWRRFNRDDWCTDRFSGKPWQELLPENQRILVNGETYVHWYDCMTDYIL